MSTFTLIKDLIVNSVKLKLGRSATVPQSVERVGAAGGDPGAGTGVAAFCAGRAGGESVGGALQRGATSVLPHHSNLNLQKLTVTSRGKS